MAQVFTISDGTTSIDLLSSTGFYRLAHYETGLNQWKNGGVFTDNQLTEGSTPVFRQFDTFEEKIAIHILGNTQDEIATRLRALITLFESGVEYFISGFGNQLYMSVKGDTETNTRYAVITSYKLEELPSQFINEYVTGGVTNGVKYANVYSQIEIVIQRGIWLEGPPNTQTHTYVQFRESFNGNTLGPTSTNTEPTFAANFNHIANITHVYVFDASSGTWTSNLVTSTSFNLFPAAAAVGDILYVGCDSTLTNSGPLFNVVFNIGTPSSGLGIVPEVYEAEHAAWSETLTQDSTNDFQNTGPGIVSIVAVNQMTTRNLNTEHGGSAPNVTGYWIRFRIATASSPTTPTQTGRSLYSANKAYIDVLDTNIDGDLEAIARADIIPYNSETANRMVIGRRAYSRGANFVSTINFSDEQNPSGVAIELIGNAYADNEFAPTGRVVSVTTALPASGDRGQINYPGPAITFDSTIAQDFIGKFRTFVRIFPTGVPNNVVARLTVGSETASGDITHTTGTGKVSYPVVASNSDTAAHMEVLDFGIIELPPVVTNTSTDIFDIFIRIGFTDLAAPSTIELVDIVLIPADECIIELDGSISSTTTTATTDKTTVIDKLASPELPVEIYIKDNTTDFLISKPIYGGADSLTLKTDRQRFWLMSYLRTYTTVASIEYNRSRGFGAFSAEFYKMNRYLINRGNI